jgi:hypothetical protein
VVRRRRGESPKATKATVSGRYTPPVPRAQKVSPRWVPVLMFTCWALGVGVVITNYLGVLPGETSNGYLLVGLGLLALGFVAATRYH